MPSIDTFLQSWLFTCANVLFTMALGAVFAWCVSKLVQFAVEERKKYQPNPYLVTLKDLISSPTFVPLMSTYLSFWNKPNNDDEIKKLKEKIDELEKNDSLKRVLQHYGPIFEISGPALEQLRKSLENKENLDKLFETYVASKLGGSNIFSDLFKASEPTTFGSRKSQNPTRAASTQSTVPETPKPSEPTISLNADLLAIIKRTINNNVNLKPEVKARLITSFLNVIEGLDYINSLTVDKNKEMEAIIKTINVSFQELVDIEIENNPKVKVEWLNYKNNFPRQHFSMEKLPVGAITDMLNCIKPKLNKPELNVKYL